MPKIFLSYWFLYIPPLIQKNSIQKKYSHRGKDLAKHVILCWKWLKYSATQDNKAIDVNNASLDKDNRESIGDNSCNGNKCNKIPDHELSTIIANDNRKNHSRINKNH